MKWRMTGYDTRKQKVTGDGREQEETSNLINEINRRHGKLT